MEFVFITACTSGLVVVHNNTFIYGFSRAHIYRLRDRDWERRRVDVATRETTKTYRFFFFS